MVHLGLICPAATGHLNTMLPLGKELQRRGHRVTLFGMLDAQRNTLAAGLEFRAIGESAFPAGSLAQSWMNLGKLNGLAALRYTVKLLRDVTAVMLRDAPRAIEQAGVEALLADQVSTGAGTVADFLQIPFVTLCSAVVLNQEDGVPPAVTSWQYHPSLWGRLRNRAGYRLFNRVLQPVTQLILEHRRRWKLPLSPHLNGSYSRLAQISQEPFEFEFPRQHLPTCFHFTGPYHDTSGREPAIFPFDKYSGQPLIYASLGSIINQRAGLFHTIAEACRTFDVQLVISHGISENESLARLPGSPIVVKYAPQLELLKRATLTITHGGLNTTLESLGNAVPIVAVPICNDQPGVAARIAWTGTGAVVPLSRLNVPRLRTAIRKVLTQHSYKSNAIRLQKAIQRAGGVTRAADIVELAISTKKPVLAQFDGRSAGRVSGIASHTSANPANPARASAANAAGSP
jgi:zeaxanthin glucosyltransferase